MPCSDDFRAVNWKFYVCLGLLGLMVILWAIAVASLVPNIFTWKAGMIALSAILVLSLVFSGLLNAADPSDLCLCMEAFYAKDCHAACRGFEVHWERARNNSISIFFAAVASLIAMSFLPATLWLTAGMVAAVCATILMAVSVCIYHLLKALPWLREVARCIG